MTEEEKNERDSLAKKRIEESTVRIASAVNLIEATIEELQFVFDSKKEWNDEVLYQIKDGERLLGESLATLVNWYKN